MSILFVNFRDYTKVKLRKNNNAIFTIDDLKVGNLEYGDKIEKAKKEFGKPIKETKKQKNGYNYIVYTYDKMILTFKENYENFILVEAKISSRKYYTSRKIKVGTSIKKVMNLYSVSNKNGNYLYGNYPEESLNNQNIYYGKRKKKNVTYINRDSVIYSDTYKVPTNIAKITYEYKYGNVSSIEWSYDID